MPRTRLAATFAALAATLALASACTPTPGGEAEDAEFAALQERGAVGMGVDQYASTHLFDALPDGGRIEFQYNSDDPAEIALIREHLRQIQTAFAAGDFSTPAFVHDLEVPGTAVMAARRDLITYEYRDLPRGGELRLITSDPGTLAAIGSFMAFQREDHRAEGVDHSTMDHSTMDHSAMGPGATGGAAAPQDDVAARRANHMMMGGGDEAFADDMEIVHQLLTNNQAITRTVEHLPNGIRTLTESATPAIARALIAHVASMERRLAAGEEFNLFSETIPVLFENYARINSEFRYIETGVEVIQTSDDPALVTALQAHSEEVTELADEGMMAMMRGMMSAGRGAEMQGMMGGRMGGMMQGGMQGGMHGNMGGMPGQGATPGTGTP